MMHMVEIAGYRPTSLDLKTVNEDVGPFCMSFGFTLDPLVRSIQEFGLINTPIVVKQAEGKVDVVSGYRRILALKNLQIEKVPCRDITDSGLSALQLLLLNFQDNRATRVFNDVEKAMILTRLAHHIPKQEIIRLYMPLLSLPSRESTLDLFLKIEGQENPIKESLAKGTLSVKALEALLEAESGFRADLIKPVLDLKLTFNQQLQFIDLTLDICLRDGKSVPELFNQPSFRGIMENEKLNPPQKAKATLELLRSVRFPLLTRSEKSFRRAVSELELPDKTRISHPPYFEGADYRLEILFKNGGQLKNRVEALNNLGSLETLGDPWEEEKA